MMPRDDREQRDELDATSSVDTAARRLPMVQPRIVYVLIAAIALVWLATELTGGTDDNLHMVNWGANFAPLVTMGEYWRLLTANWLHFGVQHLAVNAYSLYALGSQIEALFGRSRFLTIYLLSGISGAVASYVLTNGLSAGASTSIFGLFGALFVYFYRQRHVIGSASRAQLQHLIIVLVINVVFGVVAGGIDNWGHAGGLLGGLVLGWFLCPRYVRADALGRRDVELATPFIADENSLARNWLIVLAFVLVLGAIAYAASAAFRVGMAA
jgi:rhomboid protease GluP